MDSNSDLHTLSWGLGGDLFPYRIWTQNCCHYFQNKQTKKTTDLKHDEEACYGAGLPLVSLFFPVQ